MRIGDTVTFVDAAGHSFPATITAVVGAGPSGFKQLDLAVGTKDVAGVLHIGDCPDGPCWVQAGEGVPVMGSQAAKGTKERRDQDAGDLKDFQQMSEDDAAQENEEL